MKRLLLALGLVFQSVFAADWAPSSASAPPSWAPYLTNGTGTGPAGGIVSRPTGGGTLINVVTAHSIDNTGATDVYSAANAILASASPGSVVYFPHGVYRISVGLNIPSGVTVRGDGWGDPGDVGRTLIDVRPTNGEGNAFYLGDPNEGFGATPVAITEASMTKGTDTLTVASSATFTAGGYARIKLGNGTSNTFPVVHDQSISQGIQFFPVSVTEIIDGTHIRIYPKLHADYTGRSGSYAVPADGTSSYSGIGLENLEITGVNADRAGGKALKNAILFGGRSKDSWIKKIKITNFDNYAIQMTDGIRHEISHCRIQDGYGASSASTNHSGILANSGNGLLIWHNILVRNAPATELNFGIMASAIAYNYVDSNYANANVNINHGPLNSHNLYEGNYTPNINSDGFFGGSFYDTIFRNWISGLPNASGEPVQSYAIGLNRFTRGTNTVGNIINAPGYLWTNDGLSYGGIGPPTPLGTAQLSAGDPWFAWDTTARIPKTWTGTLTTKTGDYSGTITLDSGQATSFQALIDSMGGFGLAVYSGFSGLGFPEITPQSLVGSVLTFNSASGPVPSASGQSVILSAGHYGFNERDLDVEATASVYGNFNHYTSSITTAIPGGATLPDSLMGFTTASPPQAFTDAGISFPPYSPASPYSASKSSIPAGALAQATEPPIITSASWDSTGLRLTVTTNKPVSEAGGTGGFTVTASGMTLTFDSVEGSTINFIPSRAVFAGETIDLTYTAATGRWEDAQGNDLESRSAFHVVNLSTNNGSKVVYWSVPPESATSSALTMPGQGITKLSPVVVSVSGIADAVAVPIVADVYNATAKIGVFDSSNNRVSSYSYAVGADGETQYFAVTSFAVTPQTYWVGIQVDANDSTSVKKLDATPGATKEEYTAYASFPPTSITPSGTLNYTMSVGIRVIPNPVPPTFRIRGNQAIRRR